MCSGHLSDMEYQVLAEWFDHLNNTQNLKINLFGKSLSRRFFEINFDMTCSMHRYFSSIAIEACMMLNRKKVVQKYLYTFSVGENFYTSYLLQSFLIY